MGVFPVDQVGIAGQGRPGNFEKGRGRHDNFYSFYFLLKLLKIQ